MKGLRKRKMNIKGWGSKQKSPVFLCAAAVVAVLIIWIVAVFCDVVGLGFGDNHLRLVNIPNGSTLDDICEILKAEDIIRHKTVFKAVEKLDRGENVFQQGGHKLSKNMSYKRIIEKLTNTPEVTEDGSVTVLIPEGYEAWQIAEKLENEGLADKEEFLRLLDEGDFDFDFVSQIKRKENRLEGYLFPATYEFAVWETERDIIKKMLDAFEQNIVPLYNKATTDYTLDEIVTLASLVEREAANDAERGKVASVFYNRMERDMTLSSCATVQYIIKERKPILSNSDIKIKSDYNTYINKGLPIGPIASPGVNSVKAALYPENTDYLYFAARPDGSENVFSKTGEEHLNTVNILQNN